MTPRTRISGNDAPLAEINVTPFVDVMLVLFVVFLVLAPVMTKSLQIELPKVLHAATDTGKHAVDIQLDLGNTMLVDGKPVTSEHLEAFVHALAVHDPRIGVNLHADRRVSFERVAQVLASISHAGVSRLSILTEDGSASR